MKWNKLLLITASMGLLAACADEGTDEEVTDDTEEVADDTEDTTEESDATTGATQSVIGSADDLEEAFSADGGWIVIFEGDVEADQELTLAEGPTNDGEIARKLALYTQDEDRNIQERFTLTVPSVTIESENSRIQGGTVAGDVYVNANGFSMPEGTIDGDLIFGSEEYQESADLEEGEVTGEVRVEGGEEEADATTGATQSVIAGSDDLEEAFSANGGWIVIFEGDVEADQELTLAEGPTNDGEIARKLALYTQDADRNITDRYTLTIPSVTIESENSRIQGGTVAGDVYVNANGFSLPEGTIDGDLIFGSEEYQESADLEEGEVTGEVRVEE
ncbi:hypothetical protein SAMN04488102_103247 [Alkalibacterium subtropicum]|uniref:Polymer-forming protein n=1 Tax=Alkalibacterium subtropicum TaxID=753702 RepID=A0A1I1GW41_9LACT|nr:hypothetical protein [Alkalibacterium subtropicum]SFC15686.1 hypothetical protein SAMN04488102_103247 [Alkalibacterium subtropicum]